MEKIFSLIKLGIKYLFRYRRRYYFLFAALIFGFSIITFITSTKDGMYENVYYSAQSHYSGDIVVMGYERPVGSSTLYRLGQDEISVILDAGLNSGIDPQYTILRTLYNSEAVIHFYGSIVKLNHIIGCDWENEKHLLDQMNFHDIQSEAMTDNSIILSAPVASYLNVNTGDSIILEMNTRYGQKNTGQFIVGAIVNDSSIFGYYKVYISRISLNRLLLYDDNECSTIGFFFKNPSVSEQRRIQLQQYLTDKNILLQPLVYDRDGLHNISKGNWDGIKVYLFTLPVYLSEIAELLSAMDILIYLLYSMMLLIILVSAVVTYKLILHERAKEMGIMRVIGFLGFDLRMVLWTEIIILGFFSMIVGFIFSALISWAASFISFSWFSGFEIFLKNDRLVPLYIPETMITNAALMLLVLILLALAPSYRVTNKSLPGLLSGEPL